ncbi:lipopolysaccharide assembly protein LapA domain-containing protein [Coprothermobacter platensis]|jgi:uncharacterized integral membrane protein|uniref:lipopolysaccharide assembly protein LapA domain-containing protein n=1 Tax=Coprothermobacter platensis TaxID=108819 RepID=UPI00037320C9|nr:LapA family protein [Coprothermobacter platensis]
MAGTILSILVIAVAAVVFGMQNTVSMKINFLFWSFQGSSALILVVSMLLGVILGILLVLPSFNSRGRTIKGLRDEIKKLQEEKQGLQEQLDITKDLLKTVKSDSNAQDNNNSAYGKNSTEDNNSL